MNSKVITLQKLSLELAGSGDRPNVSRLLFRVTLDSGFTINRVSIVGYLQYAKYFYLQWLNRAKKAVQRTRGDCIHKFYFPPHSNIRDEIFKIKNKSVKYQDLHLFT